MRRKRYEILYKNVIKYKYRVLMGIILILIYPFTALRIPLEVKNIIDTILPKGNIRELMESSLLIFGLFFVERLIDFARSLLFYKINCNIVRDIRSDLFTKITNAGFDDLNRFSIGDLVTRVEDDIKNIRIFFIDTIAKIMNALIGVIASLYLMYRLSGVLCGIILLVLAFYLLVIKKYKKRLEILSEIYTNSIVVSKSALIDFLNNLDIIKINRHNDFIRSQYNRTLEEKREANINLGSTRITGEIIAEGILNYLPYIIIAIGGFLLMEGSLTIGAVIAFIEYSKKCIDNLKKINDYSFDISTAKISLDRINEIYYLVSKEEVQKQEDSISMQKITVQKGNSIIIKDLNLDFNQSMKLAVYGKSGTGKTTLSRVILGLESDYRGEIKFKNSREKYAYAGGYLKSEAYIISGTLMENVLMGKRYDDEKYNKVISLAKLEKIDKTRNVKNCSHGEKQKICLARELYAEHTMLIVDEGLSNIDNEDLKSIVHQLIQKENIGFIMITHNLKIMEQFKKVLYFDKMGISLHDVSDFLIEKEVK